MIVHLKKNNFILGTPFHDPFAFCNIIFRVETLSGGSTLYAHILFHPFRNHIIKLHFLKIVIE